MTRATFAMLLLASALLWIGIGAGAAKLTKQAASDWPAPNAGRPHDVETVHGGGIAR